MLTKYAIYEANRQAMLGEYLEWHKSTDLEIRTHAVWMYDIDQHFDHDVRIPSRLDRITEVVRWRGQQNGV